MQKEKNSMKLGKMEDIIKKGKSRSLLISENMRASPIEPKAIQEQIISTSQVSTKFIRKSEQVQMLTTASPFPYQTFLKTPPGIVPIFKHSTKPIGPPPVIPIQFQALAQKRANALQTHQNMKLMQQKAVGNETKTTVSTAAPSAIDLATVNHSNRSLVYREPVSTKHTAPAKNFNEIKTIDLTECTSFDQQNSIQSSTATDVRYLANGKVCIASNKSLLTTNHSVKSYGKNTNESHTATSFQLSRVHKQLLQQKHDAVTATLGNDHFSHIEKLVSQQYNEWNKLNDRGEKLLPIIETTKMSEIKCQKVQKRSRAKSAYIGDRTLIEGDEPKFSRTKSNESLEIINLDNLPEKGEKSAETRVYRTATEHDALYNMIRSDAEKHLQAKRVLEKKQDVKTYGIASSSKNVQISNGQLSDTNGPIRLLDKSTKHISKTSVMHIAKSIQSQNAAIASLPHKDKVRKLKESIESTETVLNLLENGDERQIKRTYSRSKSLSAKSRIHFKIGNPNNQTKLKKIVRKPIRAINHDQDWQAFTETLSSTVKPGQISGGKSTPNNENRSRGQSPTEIEQVLSWNTNKTLGQLPNSQLIFQRNEFDTTEMDVLAMTKIKAMRQHKNDYKNFPQLEPSMACGHSDPAACFDAIIQRLNSGHSNISCKVNERKPHQYFSIEFKQIVGALVQNKNNNCCSITADDIKEALRKTNMYDRTKNSNHFSWSRYIEYYNKKYSAAKRIQLAPAELFASAIPRTPNTFEIGQKLEAIDITQNCSLFCVCTIVDKCGYRIKLRFDGYSAVHDFWVNADSVNIFPAGWCSKTGRELEVNRRFMNNRTMTFEWREYLRQTNTQAAHRACFPNVNTARTQMNPFKIGMKLEADDIVNTGRICVATIGDVIDSRILVTFDELDSRFNYWTDIRSSYIHPINFHREDGYSIVSPPSWRLPQFTWEGYLRINRAEPVPKDAFHTREPKAFTKGMALEVVDKKNPSLIRPATILTIQDYRIKVLFIGWPEKYAYWVDDDSNDIYPAGYCKKTGHPIECPLDDFIYELPANSCGILGCRGIGNGKRPDASTHTTLAECPYEDTNWTTLLSDILPNRVDRKHKTVNSAFNIGAGPSRKVSVNPAFEKVQVSLQPTLNPAELAAMSSKDVEIFRRLQVSASFLLENRKALSELRDQWIDRLKPIRPVQVLAAAKNPLNWSKEEVAKFVSQLPNCPTLGSIFIENDIDGLAFLSLRQSDMIDIMGLSMGTALKVFNRIMLLREECNTHFIRYL